MFFYCVLYIPYKQHIVGFCFFMQSYNHYFYIIQSKPNGITAIFRIKFIFYYVLSTCCISFIFLFFLAFIWTIFLTQPFFLYQFRSFIFFCLFYQCFPQRHNIQSQPIKVWHQFMPLLSFLTKQNLQHPLRAFIFPFTDTIVVYFNYIF